MKCEVFKSIKSLFNCNYALELFGLQLSMLLIRAEHYSVITKKTNYSSVFRFDFLFPSSSLPDSQLHLSCNSSKVVSQAENWLVKEDRAIVQWVVNNVVEWAKTTIRINKPKV